MPGQTLHRKKRLFEPSDSILWDNIKPHKMAAIKERRWGLWVKGLIAGLDLKGSDSVSL